MLVIVIEFITLSRQTNILTMNKKNWGLQCFLNPIQTGGGGTFGGRDLWREGPLEALPNFKVK